MRDRKHIHNPNGVNIGDTVILDANSRIASQVVIESMTPNQMYSRVRPAKLEKPKDSDYWETMTSRMIPLPKFTKEQVEKRTSDYICWDCGLQFVGKDKEGHAVTASVSKCGLCHEKKGTTHMRTWNWLRIPD